MLWLDCDSRNKLYYGAEDDWHFQDNYQNRTTLSYLFLQPMHLCEHLEVLRRSLPAYHELEKRRAGSGHRGHLAQLARDTLPNWVDIAAFDAAKICEERVERYWLAMPNSDMHQHNKFFDMRESYAQMAPTTEPQRQFYTRTNSTGLEVLKTLLEHQHVHNMVLGRVMPTHGPQLAMPMCDRLTIDLVQPTKFHDKVLALVKESLLLNHSYSIAMLILEIQFIEFHKHAQGSTKRRVLGQRITALWPNISHAPAQRPVHQPCFRPEVGRE